MNGAAVKEELWREEKLRLLQRRMAGLAEWDAALVSWCPTQPSSFVLLCFKLPPTLLPELKSLLLKLLLLCPTLTLLWVLLTLCFPPDADNFGILRGDKKKTIYNKKFTLSHLKHIDIQSPRDRTLKSLHDLLIYLSAIWPILWSQPQTHPNTRIS